MNQENEQTEVRKPTLTEALVPIVLMIIALIVGIFIYGADPHIRLLLSAGVAAIIAFRLGFKWTEIEEGMLYAVRLALLAIVMIMVSGQIIGSWMACAIWRMR